MDGVVDSLEGMERSTHDPPHVRAETAAELVNLIKEFHRLDPPAFMGASDPAEAEKWFHEIEKKLGLMRATDEQRVTLATSMLKGEAIHWWDINKHTMAIDGMTWRDFQETFLERYFPFSDRNLKKYELMRLARKEVWAKLEKKSKGKITARSSNNPRQKKERDRPYSLPALRETTVAKRKCYKCGQNGHVSNFCQSRQQEQQELQFGASMEIEGEDFWVKEKKRKEEKTSESSNPNPNPNPRWQDQQLHHHPYSQPALVVEGQEAQQPSLGKWKCNECGQLGHLRQFCPLRQQQQHHPYSLPELVLNGQEAQLASLGKWKCSKCGQLGHMGRDCPLWQQQQQHPYGQPALVVEGQEAQQNSVAKWKCSNCGRIGHLRRDCSLLQRHRQPQQPQQAQQPPYSQPELVLDGQEAQQTSLGKWKCSKCGQLGHMVKDCPLWRQQQQQQQQHPYSQPLLVVEGQEVQQTSVDTSKCKKCGNIGHLKRDCSLLQRRQQQQQQQQPQVALVEVDVEDFWASEKKRKEEKTKSNPKRQKQHHPLNQPAPVAEGQAPRKCFTCGQTGHYKKDCPVWQQQPVEIQLPVHHIQTLGEERGLDQQSAEAQVKLIQRGPNQQSADAQMKLIQQGQNQQPAAAQVKLIQQVPNQQPAQAQVELIQQGPNQQPAQAQVKVVQQGPNQQPAQAQAKKRVKKGKKRQFSQLGAPLSAFLPELVRKGLIILRDPKPIPNPIPNGFDLEAYCAFHQGPGHKTDCCFPLKHAIQDLLEADKLKISGVQFLFNQM